MDAKEARQWLFSINYYFKGGFWPKWLKKKAMDCFMDIRSVYADVANSRLSYINDKWDKLYPGVDLLKDENAMDRYNKFVTDELHPYISRIKWSKISKLFEGATNPETCDFRLIFKPFKKMFVDYDMTPVIKK